MHTDAKWGCLIIVLFWRVVKFLIDTFRGMAGSYAHTNLVQNSCHHFGHKRHCDQFTRHFTRFSNSAFHVNVIKNVDLFKYYIYNRKVILLLISKYVEYESLSGCVTLVFQRDVTVTKTENDSGLYKWANMFLFVDKLLLSCCRYVLCWQYSICGLQVIKHG